MCFTLNIFLTYNKERLGLRPNPQERRGARGDRSAARDVALYGMFGPSEAEKRAEQARIDAEQEALNERFRKESESDFAFMSVFGVVTCGRGVLGMCLRETSGTHV